MWCMPIIDIVRIHALANRISQVNTHECIAELARQKALAITDGRNLQNAFDYLMQLRVNEQMRQLTRSEKVSNHYNPNSLPDFGRKHLRNAFTIIHGFQEAVRIDSRCGL